ncbi:MAG: hypothetical protein H7061_09500 [Bdellovibrionaceae bacterium]|nr:hypothetical protein [Bdellovibrio sp.]
MKFVFPFLILLFISSVGICQNLRLSEIKKIFVEKGLDKYVVSGQSVVRFYEEVFNNVTIPSQLDGGFASESFDLEYQAHLRPNVPEPYLTLTEITTDANALFKLHRAYYSKIKSQVFLRNYFQLAFIGLVHTIESIKRVQVLQTKDGYNVLSNLIMEHGRLITSDQKTFVTMTDFWWDYIWAYFQDYPIDLVELGNQKLRGVWLSEKKDEFRKRIEKFLASYSMLGLRKGTNPVVFRDITNQLNVRLAKNAYEIYSLRKDEKALTKARVFKYKFETRSGLTEDAERTRREIARAGLATRFRKLFTDPIEIFSESGNTFVNASLTAATRFFYSFYSLIRYFVGFLLITFPFDAAFIVAGLIILSVEGRLQFKKEFLKPPRLSTSPKKQVRLFKKALHRSVGFLIRVANDLAFSLQMLVYSYTSDTINRHVRIGSSLLIFGMGLFFSSARSMVESFVAQLAI